MIPNAGAAQRTARVIYPELPNPLTPDDSHRLFAPSSKSGSGRPRWLHTAISNRIARATEGSTDHRSIPSCFGYSRDRVWARGTTSRRGVGEPSLILIQHETVIVLQCWISQLGTG